MKEKIFLICLIIFPVMVFCYSYISESNEAMVVANSWLNFLKSKNNLLSMEINSSREIYFNGYEIGYLFNLEGTGYIFVPKYKYLPPIKAYSLSSNFDWENPGFAQDVVYELYTIYKDLEDLCGNLDSEECSKYFSQSNNLMWQELLNSEGFNQKIESSETIFAQRELAFTTLWHQSNPFNMYCPLACGSPTPVGCVATAFAQIMKYYNWPPQGNGSHSYLWDGDGCGSQTLSANFSDPYDWENMPDSASSSSPQIQKEALAELSYEVGVALEIDYGRTGSAGEPYKAITAFPQYFYYDPSMQEVNRVSLSSDQEWFSKIVEEIDNNRPLEFTIVGYNEISPLTIVGHSVVIYGYNNLTLKNSYNNFRTNFLYPEKDAKICSGTPGINYGSLSNISGGYEDSTLQYCWDLLKFDLSQIPASANVINSMLALTAFQRNGTDQIININVSRALGSWQENTVTWSNRPQASGAITNFTVPTTNWTQQSVNVTQMVQEWINGTYQNEGFLLWNPMDTTNGILWYSKESGSNYAPTLVLDYEVPPVIYFIKINFGWGGSADGWYSINNITTGYWHFNYIEGQSIIKNIFPQGAPCTIKITSPNGNESWYKGQSYNITWTRSNTYCGSNVKIELFKGGILNSTITNSTENDGIFLWDVPNSLQNGSDYKIKITDISNSNYYDFSDTNFTITQQITFGDCNNNGNYCDISDVQKSVNMNLGIEACSQCADCDLNSTCSITDVQKMVNCNLGIIIPSQCH